jgi:hypothetical protein
LARVSKDGRWHDLACGRLSRRASKSAAADFDTVGCQSQARLTLVRPPLDEADEWRRYDSNLGNAQLGKASASPRASAPVGARVVILIAYMAIQAVAEADAGAGVLDYELTAELRRVPVGVLGITRVHGGCAEQYA